MESDFVAMDNGIMKEIYSADMNYGEAKDNSDRLYILACQIKIWEAGSDIYSVPKIGQCICINECESIETFASCSRIDSKAVVILPEKAAYTQADVITNLTTALSSGIASSLTGFTQKASSSRSGIAKTASSRSGIASSLSGISQKISSSGSANKISPGMRITIRAGYVFSQQDDKAIRTDDAAAEKLPLIFSGRIKAVTGESPMTITCEDITASLRRKGLPPLITTKRYSVADFLRSGGKFDLLKDTGVSLDPLCDADNIIPGIQNFNTSLTVADLLASWRKQGITSYSAIDTDGRCLLKVEYEIPESGLDSSLLKSQNLKTIDVIRSDRDIPEGGERLEDYTTAQDLLTAVTLTGITTDGKRYKVTARPHPDNSQECQFVNEHKPRTRKQQKRKKGTKAKYSGITAELKADLTGYRVIPYFSHNTAGTEQQFKTEAAAILKKYLNGSVKGTITTFGDITAQPGDTIAYISKPHPEKSGHYTVTAASRQFGKKGYTVKIEI